MHYTHIHIHHLVLSTYCCFTLSNLSLTPYGSAALERQVDNHARDISYWLINMDCMSKPTAIDLDVHVRDDQYGQAKAQH